MPKKKTEASSTPARILYEDTYVVGRGHMQWYEDTYVVVVWKAVERASSTPA